jgi:OPT oligopeptide transporter protein
MEEKTKGQDATAKEFELKGAETGSTFDTLNKPEGTAPTHLDIESGENEWNAPAETAEDLITGVIHAEDDPTLNPWTFRMWFLGLGLSAFGGVLSTIYYFKPQTMTVSAIFLGVVSYILGEAMSHLIPRIGFMGRWLNPHPVSDTISSEEGKEMRYIWERNHL